MGKITVETCEIEGLKVITPTVFGDASAAILWRLIIIMIIKKPELIMDFVQDNQSASVKKVYCVACISRSTIRRTSWSAW